MKIYLLLIFVFGSLFSVSQENILTLSAAGISFSADKGIGGRVVSFMVEGKELLSSYKVHARFFGSSLWLSPENKWRGMGRLDDSEYAVEQITNTTIQLRSKDDSVRGFYFRKIFTINAKDSSVTLLYSITNISKDPQEVSPWEVTRVPTGGLAFFPRGLYPALAKSNVPVKESAGLVWYPYDTTTKDHQKLFIHGAEGWTAYVSDGFIFIKKYPEIKTDGSAPGEENVELYVNQQKTYMELENQGEYQKLQNNETARYEVKWYARRLPAGMVVDVGNESLTQFVCHVIHQWK